jgi:hypothetical protein
MEDIRENARFKDIVIELPGNRRQVNLDKISEWEPIPTTPAASKPPSLYATVR